ICGTYFGGVGITFRNVSLTFLELGSHLKMCCLLSNTWYHTSHWSTYSDHVSDTYQLVTPTCLNLGPHSYLTREYLRPVHSFGKSAPFLKSKSGRNNC